MIFLAVNNVLLLLLDVSRSEILCWKKKLFHIFFISKLKVPCCRIDDNLQFTNQFLNFFLFLHLYSKLEKGIKKVQFNQPITGSQLFNYSIFIPKGTITSLMWAESSPRYATVSWIHVKQNFLLELNWTTINWILSF